MLNTFLADIKAERSTKIFLKGKIFAFAAPMNIRSVAGIYMELQSSKDIQEDVLKKGER